MSQYIPTPEQFSQIVVQRSYKQMIELIDSGKVSVDYRKDTTGYTPLMIICSHYCHYDRTPNYSLGGHGYDAGAIKYLLDKGANPNACQYYPETTMGKSINFCSLPLSLVLHRYTHGEACESSLEIIKMLLTKGARPNPIQYFKDTHGSEFGGVNLTEYFKRDIYKSDDWYLAETVHNSNYGILTINVTKELLKYGCRKDTRHGANGCLTSLEVLQRCEKENRERFKLQQYKQHKDTVDKLINLLVNGVEYVEKLEADDERKRLADEAEKKRLADEADKKRLADEAEKKRLADIAERKRLADEAERKRLADEAERKKKEYEILIKERMLSNPLFAGFNFFFE